MRSPRVFQRILPTATAAIPIVLGGDPATPTIGKPGVAQDNALYCRGVETMGWPLHAVAFYYAGPGAASLSAQLWVYDDALAEAAQGNSAASGWVKLGAAQTVVPGVVYFFATLVPLQNVQGTGMAKAQGLAVPAGSGSAVGDPAYMMVVGAGASVAGTYTFCMTPVLTSQA